MSRYTKNLNSYFFGNGDRILADNSFDRYPIEFSGSDSLESILRTNLTDTSIIKFLSHMFGRIYTIDINMMKVASCESEKGKSIRCFRINLHFLKPHFWHTLEKDFINFYSLHLIELLNWKLTPPDSDVLEEFWINDYQDFETYFRDMLRRRYAQILECDLFFAIPDI